MALAGESPFALGIAAGGGDRSVEAPRGEGQLVVRCTAKHPRQRAPAELGVALLVGGDAGLHGGQRRIGRARPGEREASATPRVSPTQPSTMSERITSRRSRPMVDARQIERRRADRRDLR